MMDFFIDNVGDVVDESNKNSTDNTLVVQLLKEYKESLGQQNDKQIKRNKLKNPQDALNTSTKTNTVADVLKKSVITADYDQKHAVPPYKISQRKLRQIRKKERESTKGAKWYGLPATELTPEIKNDLEILQMRSVLDPKRFYKKNDIKVLPKYFQIGKVLDSPLDYYNNRQTKKERKRGLVEELLADAEFQKYNKRKFKEIIEDKQKTNYSEWKKMKKHRRK